MTSWCAQLNCLCIQSVSRQWSLYLWWMAIMMTSSNENIFRVTGYLCGDFTGPGEFPAQRPVTRGFDVFCDLRRNNGLNKQSWGWWFETPPWSLWRQCNVFHNRTYMEILWGLYYLPWNTCGVFRVIIRPRCSSWDTFHWHTVEPLCKGHTNWWHFKRGGLSWGVK